MTDKNPKELLFYSNNMGVQIEIPQKIITEALLEGGEKLNKLRTVLKEANDFANAYLPDPIIKKTKEDTNQQ